MRQTNTRTIAEQKPLGVIDAVSAGLALVWRRPWTLLVPILFDALLWILPRLSLTQLFRPFTNQFLNVTALSSDPQAAEETRRALQQMIDSFNVLGLVAAMLNGITRIPSLLAVNAAEVTSPISAWAYSTPLQSAPLLVVMFIPLFLLGLLGVALYLEWIAQGARPLETAAPGASFVRIAKLWLRLILFALLLGAFLIATSIVVLVLQRVFNNSALAAFAILLSSVGLFWIFIYFFFVPSAAAVSDIGLVEALKRSTLLFRVFFFPTVALVALSIFLDQGLTLVWDGLTVSSVGVVVGIVANAFIGTALIAASMVYYQDRMNVFERMRAQTKTRK